MVKAIIDIIEVRNMNREVIMHKIISRYMQTFAEEAFLPAKMDEAAMFERFANYCIIRSFYLRCCSPMLCKP